MPKWFLLPLLLLCFGCDDAPVIQPDPPTEPEPLWTSVAEFRAELEAAAAAGADSSLFQRVLAEAQVPLLFPDTAVFLWHGDASSVVWNGDFNAWSRAQEVTNAGQRIGKTWMLPVALPSDARTDYKIVIDGQWKLDPNNPLTQLSGFGPNSELRMPGYAYPEETVAREGQPTGTLSAQRRITSANLGYDVNYRVYTPPNWDGTTPLPSIYVTDGHEYANPDMGSMTVALDNLINDGAIRPLIAVFADPRDPRNGRNRRADELVRNPKYLAFVADELRPAVEAEVAVLDDPAERGILGTSLGGINAAYFGAERPDIFGRIAIQSPAFGYAPAIFDTYENADRRDLKVFMSSGSLYDAREHADRMAGIMTDKGYPLSYLKVNEGHSWGAWRAQFDTALTFLFGTP